MDHIGLNAYLVLFLMLAFGLALGLGVSALSFFLGPKKPNSRKSEVYECGLPVTSTAENRFSVKFYLTAILFILFDIETVFMYLWASLFDVLKWFGFFEVGLFLITLLVGFIYILKRDALHWENVREKKNGI